MTKKETVYAYVFKLYELEYKPKGDKEKIRSFIKRQLDKHVEIWYEYTELEKVEFAYIKIRDKMLKNYVDVSKHKRIINKLDTFLNETYMIAAPELKAHNSIIGAIFENHINALDTDSEKKENYDQLCNAIKKYNPDIPVPTYDEWNETRDRILLNPPPHCLRAYDYISSYQDEQLELNDKTIYPTQSEIDHVIIQILLKNYQEQNNVTVDVPLIKECLTFIKNFDFHADGNDELLTEYDPELAISKEDQDEIIKKNLRYFNYKKLLENLAFIKYHDGKK